MPSRRLEVTPAIPETLAAALAALRTELQVPDGFPPAVEQAAAEAVRQAQMPEADRTDLPFVTIDPPGSMDLDQALHLERDGDGFVVWYAIADVAAFVRAGDPIDVEARLRGQTLYGPDRRTPLHPATLSEDGASLLPGQVRPAFLWRIALDATGAVTGFGVERSLVRSTARLSYAEAQQQIDDGSAGEALQLLSVVGRLRQQQEAVRGGVSLELPEQEIDTSTPEWRLVFRELLPVEGWNAQISLLTGICAAKLMLDGKVGIVRTLPPADERSLRKLRQVARALRITWADGVEYPEFVRSLDPSVPAHVAMMNSCTTLFRGAGYVAFSGSVPEHAEHAAIASPYAHTTAPLRRLVDRWVLETCAALSGGRPVPEWVLSSMDEIPKIMTASDQRAKKYERAVLDLYEAHRLRPQVGQDFVGVITEVDDDGRSGQVMIADPAVEAKVTGSRLPLGEEVTVRLVTADPEQRRVAFELV